jgi:endonuclease/exonuclease/phosphatase (EEP) superfamily protein YafD
MDDDSRTAVEGPVSARTLGRILLVPVWAGVLGLLVLVGGRLVAFDDFHLLLLTDAFVLWFVLPALLVAVAAICFRARALSVVAVVVVVGLVAWVLPPAFREAPVPAAATTAPRLRVVSANVMFDNPQHRAMVDELRSLDADVLLLQEVTPDWWHAIRAGGLLKSHPHFIEAARWGADGMALLSRRPFVSKRLLHVGRRPVPTATVRVGRTEVHLVDVHVVAPVRSFDENRDQQLAINRIVRRTPKPRIVAGDYNATPTNRWYQELLDLGFHEVHEAVGDPFATTWPNGLVRVPPIRLDHVFVDDPPVVPLEVRQGRGPGSDHRPVIVNLAVLAPDR